MEREERVYSINHPKFSIVPVTGCSMAENPDGLNSWQLVMLPLREIKHIVEKKGIQILDYTEMPLDDFVKRCRPSHIPLNHFSGATLIIVPPSTDVNGLFGRFFTLPEDARDKYRLVSRDRQLLCLVYTNEMFHNHWLVRIIVWDDQSANIWGLDADNVFLWNMEGNYRALWYKLLPAPVTTVR